MNIGKREYLINGRRYEEYACENPRCILIQMVDTHDLNELDEEISEILKLSDVPFVLIAMEIKEWNKELAPWGAPPVFGKASFGDGAKDTLDIIEHDVISSVFERYGELPVILGGYSLGGLFALWSGYQTTSIQAVMAASPSVWYKDWLSYANEHEVTSKIIYLSLGDKEEKARNPIMASVGDCIRKQSDILTSKGVETILEWNEGNHFKDSEKRCAKGFVWCMKALNQ